LSWPCAPTKPNPRLNGFIWYLLTAAALIGMMVWIAALDLPGSELAMAILNA